MTQAHIAKRNHSIDIFRYFCAILVVAIHTSPLTDISDSLGYLTTEVIPRIAVPFFFVAAGYYYIEKLENGRAAFVVYFKKTAGTYLLWSLPYYLVSFCQWGHQSPISFLIDCFYSFFINGSSYHFWFMPALLISVCITTVLYRLGTRRLLLPISIALYGLGCLCCAYDTVAVRIPILEPFLSSSWLLVIRRYFLMGFPFFAAGQLLRILQKKENVLRQTSVLTVLSAALWAVEILLIHHFHLGSSIVITFGLYPFTVFVTLLLLQKPMPEKAALSQNCRAAANFMYYAHPLFIMLLDFLAGLLSASIAQTPMFLLVTILTTLIGLLIRRSGNRILKKLIQ